MNSEDERKPARLTKESIERLEELFGGDVSGIPFREAA
jgi:hypothetical protein